MDAVAILPVKRFGAAKQRLSGALGPEARAALAEAMVRDVLLALARVDAIERTLVVTGEPRAAALASFLGAAVVADERTDRVPVLETDVLMSDAGSRRRLAEETLGFAEGLAAAR